MWKRKNFYNVLSFSVIIQYGCSELDALDVNKEAESYFSEKTEFLTRIN